MTDSLRTRIITALLSEDDVALMADAVIREIGLREERVELLTRYITEWQYSE